MKPLFKKSLAVCLTLAFLVPANLINAQAIGIIDAATAQRVVGIPFGGPILGTIPCGCSSSIIVIVEDWRTFTTLQLHYQPLFSFLYLLYNLVTPGVVTLGTFSLAGPQCLQGTVVTGCTVVPTDGVIDQLPGVGTGGIPLLPF